jgi:ketosteroid isomerase-like protein
MNPMRTLSVVVVSVCLGGIAPVWGQQSREALIESFGTEIQALNAGDLEAAVAPVHEDIVLYGLYSPFPSEGKVAFRQAVQEYFEVHERAVLEPVHPEYLVAGSTGVAWGHYQLTTKLKGGTLATTHGQYMLTYARPAEEWVIISMHFAPLSGTN